MIKKVLITTLIGIPLIIAGLALYVMVYRDHIETLVACAANENVNYMPASVCRLYLYNFRPNKEDIVGLSNGPGLDLFIALPESNERDKLMRHFINKGLSVDEASRYSGLTPLHASILMNDVASAKLLLAHDANPNYLPKDNNVNDWPVNEQGGYLTAVEFLDLLVSKKPTVNRDEMKALLAPYRS